MTAADYHCTAGARAMLAQATKLWVRKKTVVSGRQGVSLQRK